MKVKGTTKVIAIFGDPVSHSLSPVMQNAAMEAAAVDMVYVPFHVKGAELGAAVSAVRALGLAGLNVTIPHKEHVIEYLDEVDDNARLLGAVNTVVNRDGKLTGYNTDGDGFVKSLMEETGFEPEGKSAVVVGAGGAARGIVAALLKHGTRDIVIANRTVKRAEAIGDEFRESFDGAAIETVCLTGELMEPFMRGVDIVINASSLGMVGKDPLDTSMLFLDKLSKKTVVSDIVYEPLDTELVKSAEAAGLKAHRGLGMLIHQGAIGFELWTGSEAPIEAMWAAVKKELDAR